MAELLSPDHVSDFPADDPAHDIEDSDLDIEEDPEEDLKEEHDMDVAKVIPYAVAPLVGSSPITPLPLSESLLDFDSVAPVTTDGTSWVASSSSIFEIEGPSSVSFALPYLLRHEVRRLRKDTETLYGSVRTLTRGMKTRWTEIATIKTGLEIIKRGAMEARPSKSINVLAVYGDARPAGSQGLPDHP
ncbi:hypothetical protein Tco_1119543 [Tanacetum coccineum]